MLDFLTVRRILGLVVPYIQFKDNKLFYQSVGSENLPAVLFLNGFGGNAENWRAIADKLKNKFYVTMFDFPGQGKSSDIHSNDLEKLNLESVKVLSDQLNMQKFHLIGFSYGGRIALRYSAAHPDQLISLILISTSPLDTPYRLNLFKNWKEALGSQKMKDFCEHLLDFLHDKDYLAKHKAEILLLCDVFCSINKKENLMSYLDDILKSKNILASELKKIDCPTLAVYGGNDRMADKEKFDYIKKIKNLRMEVLPNCGHVVSVERPVELTALIKEHLLGQELNKAR